MGFHDQFLGQTTKDIIQTKKFFKWIYKNRSMNIKISSNNRKNSSKQQKKIVQMKYSGNQKERHGINL